MVSKSSKVRDGDLIEKLDKNYESKLSSIKYGIWEWDINNNTYKLIDDFGGYCESSKDRSDLYAEDWKKIIHPEDLGLAIKRLEYALKEKQENYKNVYRIKCKDGKYKWVLSKGRAIVDEKKDIIGFIGFHIDITERISMEERIYDLLYYDQMTKLPNKEKVSKDFRGMVSRVNSIEGMAFLVLDIDNFGYINSSLGYEEGNRVIKRLAKFLINRFKGHVVSKIGDDEFLIIYKYNKTRSELEYEVGKLLREIRNSKLVYNDMLNLSISIGISVYKEHGESFYGLLKNADIALNCSKLKGKNTYSFYQDKMECNVFKSIDMINEIRCGINRDEFYMNYQPIINLRRDSVVGLEALVRWNHPQKGSISPADFIPVAEESGEIANLEKKIIEMVFHQIKRWKDKSIEPNISINLSPSGIIQDNLMGFLDSLIKKYGICSDKIEFEVTETAIIKDIAGSIVILNKLIDRGFRVTLDDFGTGYSSLNYLRQLPISKLKLDKSFIDTLERSKEDQVLVKTIVDLADNLKLRVVAEGVEKINQINILKTMNCDCVQGYFYSKPLSSEEVESWLKKNYIDLSGKLKRKVTL